MMADKLTALERDYYTAAIRRLTTDLGLSDRQLGMRLQISTDQAKRLRQAAGIAAPHKVTSHRTRKPREQWLPPLTDERKAELAPRVTELASQRMTDAAIGREIGLSPDQARKIREHAGVAAGRRASGTYSAKAGTTVMCPACSTAVAVNRHGRLEDHRYLGATRGGIRVAVECKGSK